MSDTLLYFFNLFLNTSANILYFFNVLDLVYLGIETDFPEQLSSLPYKKKRNHDLFQEEKEYTKIHSKKRIVIEDIIICRLKKNRIMSEVIRNNLHFQV